MCFANLACAPSSEDFPIFPLSKSQFFKIMVVFQGKQGRKMVEKQG